MHLVVDWGRQRAVVVVQDLNVAAVELPVMVRADEQDVARDVETAIRQLIEVMCFRVSSTITHVESVAVDLALPPPASFNSRTTPPSRSYRSAISLAFSGGWPSSSASIPVTLVDTHTDTPVTAITRIVLHKRN